MYRVLLGHNPKYSHTFRDESFMGFVKGTSDEKQKSNDALVASLPLDQDFRRCATEEAWSSPSYVAFTVWGEHAEEIR